MPHDAGQTLLPIARSAIARAVGVDHAAHEQAPWLHLPRATFVTLKKDGELRGCIGSIEPRRTLLADVKSNAVAAALHDRRFTPVDTKELHEIRVEVSLLSPVEAIPVRNEDEAVKALRPHIDGVVLHMGLRRATFLPQVWGQLPDPLDFLAHLKRKAGLPPAFWDESIRLERYTVGKWSEDASP